DEIRAEGLRYSPTSNAVSIKSLEITKPAAHVVRDSDGIHALGLTLKQSFNMAPSTSASAAPQLAGAPAPSPSDPAAFTIGRFTISGIDLLLEDKLGDVPTVLPINALDVEVKGLSSAALSEPRSIRYTALVGAGKVALASNDGKSASATQDRPVFAEVSSSG